MALFPSLSPFPSPFLLFNSIPAVIKVSAAVFFSIRITQFIEHLIISCKTVPQLNVLLDPGLELVGCSGAQPKFSTDGIQFHSFVHCGGCRLVWVGLLWEPLTPVAKSTDAEKAAFATNELLCTCRPLLWYYTRQCMEDLLALTFEIPGRKADNGSHNADTHHS